MDEDAGAFMDTAAIIRNVDLVITSDTSIPHLAGALGAPVWLLLSAVPDWRWFLEGDNSPWYPTMRIFRSHQRGCWKNVFSDVARMF
jgi:ADP-heptose:LPS heptosyltransferase